MELKTLDFLNGNKKIQEQFVVSKNLTTYGWCVVEYATEVFHQFGSNTNVSAIQKYLNKTYDSHFNEFVLSPNTLLHFSTGLTSVETVQDILHNGLKCFEANISKFNNFGKSKSESNYVVDTWHIATPMTYSSFAKHSPKYVEGIDFDMADFERHYAPAYSLVQYTPSFLKDIRESANGNFNFSISQRKALENRALQNIGFIIDGETLPEDIQKLDIYQNETLQKEFCGNSFLSQSKMKGCYTILDGEDSRAKIVGRYGVSSYVYGVPSEFIMGIVAPFGMLYNDILCSQLFYAGLNTKFVLSPTGKLLYTPNPNVSIDENLRTFLNNKNSFLEECDPEYKAQHIIDLHSKNNIAIIDVADDEKQDDKMMVLNNIKCYLDEIEKTDNKDDDCTIKSYVETDTAVLVDIPMESVAKMTENMLYSDDTSIMN